MFTRLMTAAVVATFALPAMAQDQSVETRLFDALGMSDIIEIMREEGIVYGRQIGDDLLGGMVGTEWMAVVETIYDAEMMKTVVAAQMREELEGADVQAMLDFFSTDRGVRIIALEVSARRALLDDAVEEASKEAAAMASVDETPRFLQVQRFVEANDLIETNVVGAMNSNFAFYMGLMDGGALDGDITEQQILTDVWSQEAEIRQNTSEWVYSFSLMAYQPLSDADLDAYIAFSESDAGQDLNSALFGAFDGLFDDISFALGVASSVYMTGQEL